MDHNEFRALIMTHQSELYRYLRYLGAQSEVAEDIAQDAFLVIYRKGFKDGIEGDARQEAAWLRGIARNLFLTYCRNTKRSPITYNSDYMATSEEFWQVEFLNEGQDDGYEYLEALRTCMGKLNPKQQQALILRYRENISREIMATKLKMSENGVKSLLQRLRKALGECVTRRIKRMEAGL